MGEKVKDQAEGSSPSTASSSSSSSPRRHPIPVQNPISQPDRAALEAPVENPPANGFSFTLFECPVCSRSFPSERDVSTHLDTCRTPDVSEWLPQWVSAFLSTRYSDTSVEIVLKHLRDVVREPKNEKFRRIHMSNPKILEEISEVNGIVDLLECLGFRLKDEGGEVWATMETPSEKQVATIKEAVSLLEGWMPELSDSVARSKSVESLVEHKKINRQVRVLFSVPENEAAKIELPETSREADMRNKKMAESEAMAARNKYDSTIIRIQFPGGVMLQRTFRSCEPTTMLYEFASFALKEDSLEFVLLVPAAVPKLRVIPDYREAGDRMQAPTLEEEGLVPSALVKFVPIGTADSIVFTGLVDEYLEARETPTSIF